MHPLIYFLHIIPSIIISNFSIVVISHGFVKIPPARNYYQKIPIHQTYDPQSLAAGGPSLVYKTPTTYQHGLCGNKATDSIQNWNIPGPVHPSAKYIQGKSIKITLEITAHHLGYFRFHICDSLYISEKCFSKNPIQKVNCVNSSNIDCFRIWKPPASSEIYSYSLNTLVGSKQSVNVSEHTSLYSFALQLPKNITCHACVLRWHWYTTNSCMSVNQGPKQSVSEEFWNCIDISISPPLVASTGSSSALPIVSLTPLQKHKLLYDRPLNLLALPQTLLNMVSYCPQIPHPANVSSPQGYSYTSILNGNIKTVVF